MSDSKTSSGGIGFAALLTIAFIVLKLCKLIDWPWIWVISPIWISIGLVLLVFGGIGLYCFIQLRIEERKIDKRIEERQAELTDLQNKANGLSDQIGGFATKSKWQQRLEEMQQAKH
jgi:hypothetical protein